MKSRRHSTKFTKAAMTPITIVFASATRFHWTSPRARARRAVPIAVRATLTVGPARNIKGKKSPAGHQLDERTTRNMNRTVATQPATQDVTPIPSGTPPLRDTDEQNWRCPHSEHVTT